MNKSLEDARKRIPEAVEKAKAAAAKEKEKEKEAEPAAMGDGTSEPKTPDTPKEPGAPGDGK